MCAIDEVARQWDVDLERGLSEREVDERRQRFGANSLRQGRRKSNWRILLSQFGSLVVLLLLAAAAISAVVGQTAEAIAIAAALFINAAIGFFSELKALRSMEALRQIGQMETNVLRDGQAHRVAAERLVPGDIVLLQEGDVVPADLRVAVAEGLQCNEAALTGESMPVAKDTEPADDPEAPLAERFGMAYKGTSVTRGAGHGVVVATGMDTEIGRIAAMVQDAKEESTPLEQRLDELGRRLVWLVLGVAVVTGVAGAMAGANLLLLAETTIILAIAAVPEGLPIVATIALARGMWRMGHQNALVKRLSAVETLGATSVILSDKTGTLTENRMVVRRMVTAAGALERSPGERPGRGALYRDGVQVQGDDDALLRALLRAAVLCNNARLAQSPEEHATGDPMEVALLEAGADAGLWHHALIERLPEEREESFDRKTNMMATFHRDNGGGGGGDGYLIAVKGAPEAVIAACTRVMAAGDEAGEALDAEGRRLWLANNVHMARDGLRVLAVAQGRAAALDADPYRDLTLLGLIGLYDPPRAAVKQALASCRAAGIRVVMVTGDQPATAASIAHTLGIVDHADAPVIEGKHLHAGMDNAQLLAAPVFARVSPEQKLALVVAHQEANAVVGMTGDGVNDAPALKKADIGIAMGRRGTEVARETSDVVLGDDAFETIVMAVAQGRAIYDNIRKLIVYLLSGNLGEIMAVAGAALVGAPLPLLPLQILFINLLFDVFPALSLGVGKGSPDVMERRPRDPREPIVTGEHWGVIGGYGALIAASVLGAFAWALEVEGMPVAQAVSVSFLTFGFARLVHVFNMRSPGSGLLRNDIVQNPYVWGALALCTCLLIAAVYLPGLDTLLGVVEPGAVGWTIIAVGASVPLVVGQLAITATGLWHRHLRRRRSRAR